MKTPLLFVVAGLAWLLASGAVTAVPEAPLPNAMCPVTPDEPAEREIWLDHAGTRIHFCCPKCRRKFEASPSSYVVEAPEGTQHSDGHQHSHEKPEQVFRDFLGRLHPVSVHFPIALFVLAGFCELAFAFTGRDFLRASAGFNLALGWALGGAAAALGWINAASNGTVDHSALLSQHRWSAIALMVVASTALVIWPWKGNPVSKGRTAAARIILGITVILTVLVGHLGGSLVFGANYLRW